MGQCVFILLLCISTSLLYGQNRAIVQSRSAFIYAEPGEGSEVFSIMRKGVVLSTLGKYVDSTDNLWFKALGAEGDTGWVKAENLKFVKAGADSLSAPALSASSSISKQSPNARMRYIKDHPQIGRRIKKLIKDGFIGLGMTTDQVLASLGRPDVERNVFLLKRGEMPVWIYQASEPVVILFEAGRVTGWSRE